MAGCDTAEITRRAGISKPSMWHRQGRFTREGVAGLLRDRTRKPGLPPLLPAQIEPPGEATHWTGRAMAAATGISLRSVQRIWAAAHGHAKRIERLEPDPGIGRRAHMAELTRGAAAAGHDTAMAADPFFMD